MKSLSIAAGLIVGFVVSISAGPIETLQAGQWAELPCVNKIRDVLPSPVPAGNGPGSIITAWNSGAYDTKRDRLIIWGGGHQDYQGNEMYIFDIVTLKWTRLTNPSSSPISVHTYDALEYLPKQDWFFTQGGSQWPTGYALSETHIFDFATNTWSQKATHPTGGLLGNITAYDPVTGLLYWDGVGGSVDHLWAYDPTADKWISRGNQSAGNYHQIGTLDPKRRLFFRIGGGEMQQYDISAAGNCQVQTLSTAGPDDMVQANYPGVEYDPTGENFVAWNGGTSVYTYDPVGKAWLRHSTGGANPGVTGDWGTFGHWRYIPSKNVFIEISSIDANVFVYRQTAAASAPQWYMDLLKGSATAASNLSGNRTHSRALTSASRLFCDGNRVRIEYALPVHYEAVDLSGKRVRPLSH